MNMLSKRTSVIHHQRVEAFIGILGRERSPLLIIIICQSKCFANKLSPGNLAVMSSALYFASNFKHCKVCSTHLPQCSRAFT